MGDAIRAVQKQDKKFQNNNNNEKKKPKTLSKDNRDNFKKVWDKFSEN